MNHSVLKTSFAFVMLAVTAVSTQTASAGVNTEALATRNVDMNFTAPESVRITASPGNLSTGMTKGAVLLTAEASSPGNTVAMPISGFNTVGSPHAVEYLEFLRGQSTKASILGKSVMTAIDGGLIALTPTQPDGRSWVEGRDGIICTMSFFDYTQTDSGAHNVNDFIPLESIPPDVYPITIVAAVWED